MGIVYPIYVLETDDFSFREFACADDLWYCEKPDVLEGLYEGWDSRGRHFAVVWDERKEAPRIALEQQESLALFLNCVNFYESHCNEHNVIFSVLCNDNKNLCSSTHLRRRISEIGGGGKGSG